MQKKEEKGEKRDWRSDRQTYRQIDVDKYTYADMQTCQVSSLGRLPAIW